MNVLDRLKNEYIEQVKCGRLEEAARTLAKRDELLPKERDSMTYNYPPSITLTYAELIEDAKMLLHEQIRDPEGERNDEYTRGIVDLIATAFGREGMDTGTRMDEVAEDIGLRVRYA